MMKEKIRTEKGISLISLTITIMVLVILSNIIIYNVKDSLQVGKLKEMQNDISNLRDKIASYYVQNGKIPASIKYTNIDHIKSAGVISDATDTGDFLVIDLTALENLTLNYGEDFEEVKKSQGNVNDYQDLYIINESSHNIFYVAGITVDNDTFYTDYTSSDVDTAFVGLRYVENVKIPDGYTYVEGNKKTGIVIKNNTDGKTYTWIVENETITQVPDDVVIDANKEYEFLNSVNRFDGYYKSDDNTVIYIEAIEGWSPTYDVEGIYKDKNGDTAYIPKGFQVSLKPGETEINEGLVVRNADDFNEFVWIPTDLVTYQIYNWSKGQGATGFTEYYASDATENAKIIEEIDASVSTHNGYYISRYEAGTTKKRTSKTETASSQMPKPIFRATTTETPVYAYNWVDWDDAIYITSPENLYNKENHDVDSRLINARGWDTALKFIETIGADVDATYPTDSTGKGWYLDNQNNSNHETGKSVDLTNATVPNKLKNIYDMGGNMWEWTADMKNNNTDARALRGGMYKDSGLSWSAAVRDARSYDTDYGAYGLRIALYL